MIRVSKTAMIAAVAAALATPAFAQSFDPEAGTGNVLPFSFAPTAAQSSTVTVRQGGHGRWLPIAAAFMPLPWCRAASAPLGRQFQ